MAVLHGGWGFGTQVTGPEAEPGASAMAIAGQPLLEVITLTVGGHAFCIDIFAVREIRGKAKAG